jgi:hypothetical protein
MRSTSQHRRRDRAQRAGSGPGLGSLAPGPPAKARCRLQPPRPRTLAGDPPKRASHEATLPSGGGSRAAEADQNVLRRVVETFPTPPLALCAISDSSLHSPERCSIRAERVVETALSLAEPLLTAAEVADLLAVPRSSVYEYASGSRSAAVHPNRPASSLPPQRDRGVARAAGLPYVLSATSSGWAVASNNRVSFSAASCCGT